MLLQLFLHLGGKLDLLINSHGGVGNHMDPYTNQSYQHWQLIHGVKLVNKWVLTWKWMYRFFFSFFSLFFFLVLFFFFFLDFPLTWINPPLKHGSNCDLAHIHSISGYGISNDLKSRTIPQSTQYLLQLFKNTVVILNWYWNVKKGFKNVLLLSLNTRLPQETVFTARQKKSNSHVWMSFFLKATLFKLYSISSFSRHGQKNLSLNLL